jgi:hypothetical protein
MAVESGQEYINAESILYAWKSMQGVNKALKILETRSMPYPGTTLDG